MSTATLKSQEHKPHDPVDLPPAHSLRDAANTLEGYAAMNDVRDPEIADEVLEHQVDEHEVSKLAFDFFLERGCQHGAHEDDWYRAEREVRARRQR
jgi:hypothetical protein